MPDGNVAGTDQSDEQGRAEAARPQGRIGVSLGSLGKQLQNSALLDCQFWRAHGGFVGDS
jgi:hypothetical protein